LRHDAPRAKGASICTLLRAIRLFGRYLTRGQDRHPQRACAHNRCGLGTEVRRWRGPGCHHPGRRQFVRGLPGWAASVPCAASASATPPPSSTRGGGFASEAPSTSGYHHMPMGHQVLRVAVDLPTEPGTGTARGREPSRCSSLQTPYGEQESLGPDSRNLFVQRRLLDVRSPDGRGTGDSAAACCHVSTRPHVHRRRRPGHAGARLTPIPTVPSVALAQTYMGITSYLTHRPCSCPARGQALFPVISADDISGHRLPVAVIPDITTVFGCLPRPARGAHMANPPLESAMRPRAVGAICHSRGPPAQGLATYRRSPLWPHTPRARHPAGLNLRSSPTGARRNPLANSCSKNRSRRRHPRHSWWRAGRPLPAGRNPLTTPVARTPWPHRPVCPMRADHPSPGLYQLMIGSW